MAPLVGAFFIYGDNMNYHSGERVTSTHVYFWNGIFSQWFIRQFSDLGTDTRYNCAEQYMMRQKALMFNDKQIAHEIMTSRTARAQKAWGRKVRNYDDAIWSKERYQVVVNANMAKFLQHQDLKESLLETGNKTIVEASPYDKIWGVGLHFEDDRILDEKNWDGENLLGKALMEVRDHLNKVRQQ